MRYVINLITSIWEVYMPLCKDKKKKSILRGDKAYLLYVPYNVFEGNLYIYTLTRVDVASRHKKFARALFKQLCHITFKLRPTIKLKYLCVLKHWTKKACKVSFVLEAVYKKGGVFEHTKVLQCDYEPKFESDVITLLKKHKVGVRPTTKKM